MSAWKKIEGNAETYYWHPVTNETRWTVPQDYYNHPESQPDESDHHADHVSVIEDQLTDLGLNENQRRLIAMKALSAIKRSNTMHASNSREPSHIRRDRRAHSAARRTRTQPRDVSPSRSVRMPKETPVNRARSNPRRTYGKTSNNVQYDYSNIHTTRPQPRAASPINSLASSPIQPVHSNVKGSRTQRRAGSPSRSGRMRNVSSVNRARSNTRQTSRPHPRATSPTNSVQWPKPPTVIAAGTSRRQAQRAHSTIHTSRTQPQDSSNFRPTAPPRGRIISHNVSGAGHSVASEEIPDLYGSVYMAASSVCQRPISDQYPNSEYSSYGDDNDGNPEPFPRKDYLPSPVASEIAPKRANYHITFTTGDKMFAGTNCNVFITFTDMTGFVYEPIKIMNNGSVFGRNTTYEKKISLNSNKSGENEVTKFKGGF